MKPSLFGHSKSSKNDLYFNQQMVLALKEDKSPLEIEFVCISCFGILINPLKCKCGASYCERCFTQSTNSTMICYCIESKKKNFAGFIPTGLSATQYLCKSGNSKKTKVMNYSQVLSDLQKGKCIFDYQMISESEINKFEVERFIYFLIINKDEFATKCKYKFSEKEARMINFNFSKGYSLNFERKEICLKLIQFLKLLKIKQISFCECFLISPYIFPLCQIIKKNRKRL